MMRCSLYLRQRTERVVHLDHQSESRQKWESVLSSQNLEGTLVVKVLLRHEVELVLTVRAVEPDAIYGFGVLTNSQPIL